MTDIDLSNLSQVISVYRAAVSEIAKWEKIRDDLNKTLKHVMADADVALVNGVPAIRRTVVATSRFDSKLFRDEFPELAEKYVVPGSYVKLTLIKATDGDASPN